MRGAHVTNWAYHLSFASSYIYQVLEACLELFPLQSKCSLVLDWNCYIFFHFSPYTED